MRDNPPETLSSDQLLQFHTDGYLVIRQLFEQVEVAEIRNTFMDIHAGPPIPGFFEPLGEKEAGDDILKRYPRILQPHYFNATALKFMLHPRLIPILADLFGEEPLASQSMFYYKPPGARGQALHQDNYYLKVEPGTCIAAWTAIDDCDMANGGMMVVPQTGEIDLFCPEQADSRVSFTQAIVHVPKGMKAVSVEMKAGDTLFFNGNVIHGSGPNRTSDRFRRSFTCHYVGVSTEKLGSYFSKLYRADGSVIQQRINAETGPCGDEFAGFYGH
ncbi:phytanoyl-CoA dioxygenase family protein [Cohnella silvisoli]|uniref:Phytanoyl-CoA dioxygenase family protein n=1 Tax=Cohnella silvisoli TaxID=2873699 RepID=A0ABV1L1K6_9BACL|nr:phytanoyl-CoA dioxygenase family protein [Cohnella silvisoli]MCD9024877.1 phytanoyl-CoA dioxygenase family protein [Cohnella silvisoli]